MRVVFGTEGQVYARNDYYPFGKQHANPALSTQMPPAGNRFQFNGKENQIFGDLGYLDYGARMYNPETARWFGIDPLAEKYLSHSPYAFVGNNPIRNLEIDGNTWVNANGKAMWANGKWTEHATSKDISAGTALQSTNTGKQQFEYLVTSPINIQVIWNYSDMEKGDGGETITGKASAAGVKYSKKSDEVTAESGTIVIFEQNITKVAEDRGITADEQRSSTLGHEIEHLTPNNIRLAVGNEALNESNDVEKTPKEVGSKILEESKAQRSQP